MLLLWLLLFLILIITAFGLGYQYHIWEEQRKQKGPSISREYLAGINLIINEETDKAVDHFIKMLAVDSNTVETHLALGKLFRRRGEVDRAIRIHQNLIARPQLEKHYRDQSFFELGCDYLSAGMLDRAERVFMEVTQESTFATVALKMLIDIYQQEKMWNRAIWAAEQYQIHAKQSQQAIIAHFHCELAEQSIHAKCYDDATHYLQQAVSSNPHSVRTHLLHGQLAMLLDHYQKALSYLERIPLQNPRYIADVLPLIVENYKALQQEDALQAYLQSVVDRFPSTAILKIFAELLRKRQNDQAAAAFVKDYVRRYPSMPGVVLYLQLIRSSVGGQIKDDLNILQRLIKKILSSVPRYQCTSCGFSGNSKYWLCPGCKQWDTILPLADHE